MTYSDAAANGVPTVQACEGTFSGACDQYEPPDTDKTTCPTCGRPLVTAATSTATGA